MMNSSDRWNPIDLDKGLPTTREDVIALQPVRSLGTLDLEGYLAFLSRLRMPGASAQRAKSGPRGGPPFELTD
jgi:hypothetical protein